MHPSLRVVTEDGRAKREFLGVVRATDPLFTLNARLILVQEMKGTKEFIAWFAASYPTATPIDPGEAIVNAAGYPTSYFLYRMAEVE